MSVPKFKVGDIVTTNGDHPSVSGVGEIVKFKVLDPIDQRGKYLYGLEIVGWQWFYWAFEDQLTLDSMTLEELREYHTKFVHRDKPWCGIDLPGRKRQWVSDQIKHRAAVKCIDEALAALNEADNRDGGG